jgi:cytoskeletal protein CcmA (bactofilin family)
VFRRPTPPTAPEPPAPEPRPARRFTDAPAAPATLIGPGTRVKGELSGEDDVEVGGSLQGRSQVRGHYHVRPGARVEGDLQAASLLVEGELSARSVVADKVEIGAAASVRANLRARVVAIAEGAFFDGQVHMNGRQGPTAFKEKRQGRRE